MNREQKIKAVNKILKDWKGSEVWRGRYKDFRLYVKGLDRGESS